MLYVWGYGGGTLPVSFFGFGLAKPRFGGASPHKAKAKSFRLFLFVGAGAVAVGRRRAPAGPGEGRGRGTPDARAAGGQAAAAARRAAPAGGGGACAAGCRFREAFRRVLWRAPCHMPHAHAKADKMLLSEIRHRQTHT